MNLNGGFFTDSQNGVPEIIQKIVKCEVKRCVYPTTKNLIYYLSEHGDLFSTQLIQGKVLVRGPKQPASKHKKGKRKDGGITHRLSNGHHGKGSESFIPAELLIYCTFILKRWKPDLQICFKNGIASDLRPDNLQEYKNDIPHDWNKRLEFWKDIYQSQFNEVARYVKWWTGISLEDSKDVVQSAYIYICTSGHKKDPENFLGLWRYIAKLRAIGFMKSHTFRYNNEDFDLISETTGIEQFMYEIDFIRFCRGERRQRFLTLWSKGYTPTEIAEMENTTIGNVGSSITRSIQYLQKYFTNDKEIFRHRTSADV